MLYVWNVRDIQGTYNTYSFQMSSPVMGIWVQNGGKLEEITPPSATPLLEQEKQPALMLCK